MSERPGSPDGIAPGMRIVILGLSITSSWGNGHATTFRSLVRGLCERGHDVLFLERDQPWYADNRDLPKPPYGRIEIYDSLAELRERFGPEIRDADVVVIGSFVPDGVVVGDWVARAARGIKAFYDIDTPVTLALLAREDCDYLCPRQVPEYDLYLSFTGGPILERVARRYRAAHVRPLYCGCDPELYHPEPREALWELGYLGTYSADRQPLLDRLLLEPARRLVESRFAVAGAQYPEDLVWPANVERISHLAPPAHRGFYTAQRFTLNVTRADMIRWGYAPSVRLFEAAACGTPVISDSWEGLDTFFEPGREILVARSSAEMIRYLVEFPETLRQRMGQRARARVLAEHTAAHRAAALESYVAECRGGRVSAATPARRRTAS